MSVVLTLPLCHEPRIEEQNKQNVDNVHAYIISRRLQGPLISYSSSFLKLPTCKTERPVTLLSCDTINSAIDRIYRRPLTLGT